MFSCANRPGMAIAATGTDCGGPYRILLVGSGAAIVNSYVGSNGPVCIGMPIRPSDETHQAERAKFPKSNARYDWRDKCGTAERQPIAQRPPSPTLFRRAAVYADPAEPRLPHSSTPYEQPFHPVKLE
jgi:hypothetical protein